MSDTRKGAYHQTRPWTNGKHAIKFEKMIRAEFERLPTNEQEGLQLLFDMDKAWLPKGIGLYGWLELRAGIQYKDELDKLAQWRMREGEHG